MVSLRDGKTYDPGAVSETTSGRGRRASVGCKDSTAVSGRRPVTRRSKLASLEQPEISNLQEPPSPIAETPSSTKTRAKRVRNQVLIPEMELPDTYHKDTDVAEAAEVELPEEVAGTPSPGPDRKKPRIIVTPPKSRLSGPVAVALAISAVLLAVAVAVVLSGQDPQQLGMEAHQLSLQYLQRTKAGAQTYFKVLSQQSADSLSAAAAWSHQAREQLQMRMMLAQERSQDLLSETQLQLSQLISHAMDQLSQINGSSKQQQPVGPSFRYEAAAVAELLPAGPQWQDLAQDISDLLNRPVAARAKGSAILIACSSPENCQTISSSLTRLPQPQQQDEGVQAAASDSSKCLLQLSAPSLPSAADLQAALAPFLHSCPTGQVLLQHLEELPLPAWPALLNALSELGGFQHGGTVDATRAAYMLLLQLPREVVADAAALGDPLAAGQLLKGQVLELLRQRASASAEAVVDDVEALARAIHRRLDFAVAARGGGEGFEDLAAAAADADDVFEGIPAEGDSSGEGVDGGGMEAEGDSADDIIGDHERMLSEEEGEVQEEEQQ